MVLGFQADLSRGADTQEFRASAVKLLSYTSAGVITRSAAVSPAVQQPEQYYSISGVRLPAYPQKGLFIVRQGSRSKKVSR